MVSDSFTLAKLKCNFGLINSTSQNILGSLGSSKTFVVTLIHPERSSENSCDFEDVRKYILPFTMLVYEKLVVEA